MQCSTTVRPLLSPRERHAEIFTNNSRQQYLNTVAHELGHSLLDLCHTHESSKETDQYEGECEIREDVHGKRYHESEFQEYHDEYVFDPNDVSIMSYQYAMSDEERRSYTLASDYISCRQLHIKELDLTNCRGAEVIDPDYVEAQPPSEPEGTRPDPPTAVTAVGRDGEILVKWSPPFNDGGSPLTGYIVEYHDGSSTQYLGPISSHSYLIEGLTNGVEYEIGVRAENGIGTSEVALASATPQQEEPTGTRPGPVVNLTATGAERQVRVEWSPPSDDGGAVISGYSVLYRPSGGDWVRWPHTGTSASATIAGLAAGTEYEIEVTARNVIGHGQSQYTRARTLEDECIASTGEHRHVPQNLCHADHQWSSTNPPPCLDGQTRDYTYHDPNDNDRHITRTVAACPEDPVLPSDPTLTVRRGSAVTDDDDCGPAVGCRWVIGSGSRWPAGEQFWIRCGDFVDTSQNFPVPYYDRFVNDDGTLEWGESICYSAGRHVVEVWTQSGVRETVTIEAAERPPLSDPTLTVRRGSAVTDDDDCGPAVGCRWVIGSGSRWPAGEQFWIRCGDFVDTSQNFPVPYYDRFVNDDGTLEWGESICYSAGRHVVEVWTQSGVRETVTIEAAERPPLSDPTLTVRRGSAVTDDDDCGPAVGCRWVIGSGSRWPAGEQFWIRCGDFVDTSQNFPVPYYDRFVNDDGTLEWGESICYSAGRHVVEVWTQSGVRETVTIEG